MNRRLVLSLTLLLSLNFGCKESKSSSSSSIAIPTISISCATANDCISNAAHTKPAMVAIFTGTCANLIAGTVQPSIFSATAMSCSGGTCTGSIAMWFNSSAAVITTMTPGTYSLASYIDTNENDDGDTGEPYSCQEGVSFTSNAAKSITSWGQWP